MSAPLRDLSTRPPREAAPPDAAHGPPLRWLPLALGALLLMMTTGLGLVWWWGHRPGPALPVLGELPEFHLVAQHGEAVTRDSLAGDPAILDLIYTRCPLECPRMTDRLAALGDQLAPGVRRVSVSVDPEHDTPAALAAFAQQHHAVAHGWWFLTGPMPEIHRLAVDGLKLGVVTTPAEDPRAAQLAITHSTKLVLVDGNGRIRGYYDAFDDGSTGRLVHDAERLARGDADAPR